jgi:hypothetical protein
MSRISFASLYSLFNWLKASLSDGFFCLNLISFGPRLTLSPETLFSS